MHNPIADEHRSLTRARWTVVVMIAATGLLLAAWWMIAFSGTGQPRTVEDLVATAPEIHPENATAALCFEGGPPCVEGWRTDVGNYLRFGSSDEAELWASYLGDQGRRWNEIVLDLGTKESTLEVRRLAIDILFSRRAS